MAEITAVFDTKDKTLSVTMDGKKMKNVSEATFFTFGDTGGVEVRSFSRDEDNDTITITKILANENGCETTTESQSSVNTAKLSQSLFPKRDILGV